MTVERMEIQDGKPVPTGTFETLEADSVILALGQATETGFLEGVEGIKFESDGTVVVDEHMMTGHAGIFAGGDMVPSERTVTIATGHGKKAARNIDAWLGSSNYQKTASNPLVPVEQLQVWYRTNADASRAAAYRPQDTAVTGFDEIVAGSLRGRGPL